MPSILIPIFALLALAMLCEYAETRCRSYYRDQWLLRGSGFFLGGAVVLGLVFLAL